MKVFTGRITGASAWTRREVAGKEELRQALTPAQLDAFAKVLSRTRHLPPQKPTREDFDDPEIIELAASASAAIHRGRGVVLLSGINRETHSEEEMERIYWGIGTHLGHAATQSMLGDKLGHVKHVKGDPVARKYRSNDEFVPHTDVHQVVGLMCLQRAETGGHSELVSSLAIHNEIAAMRPDLLEPLYEGYYYAESEAQKTNRPVTEQKIPVFCYVDGLVSCCYVRFFMERAAQLRGEQLPPRLVEAMDYFDALAKREDLSVRFMLEPGEILLWHDFQMLHARENYEDSPTHTRHLLRLWLTTNEDRPVAKEFLQRVEIYERAFQRAASPGSIGAPA
jgi:hypothetical protein